MQSATSCAVSARAAAICSSGQPDTTNPRICSSWGDRRADPGLGRPGRRLGGVPGARVTRRLSAGGDRGHRARPWVTMSIGVRCRGQAAVRPAHPSSHDATICRGRSYVAAAATASRCRTRGMTFSPHRRRAPPRELSVAQPSTRSEDAPARSLRLVCRRRSASAAGAGRAPARRCRLRPQLHYPGPLLGPEQGAEQPSPPSANPGRAGCLTHPHDGCRPGGSPRATTPRTTPTDPGSRYF
jgi:hypothetical protein